MVVGGDVPYMFYSALSIGNVTKLFEKLSRLSSPAGGGESSIKTPIARPTTEKWAILSRKTLSKTLFPFLPIPHIWQLSSTQQRQSFENPTILIIELKLFKWTNMDTCNNIARLWLVQLDSLGHACYKNVLLFTVFRQRLASRERQGCYTYIDLALWRNPRGRR